MPTVRSTGLLPGIHDSSSLGHDEQSVYGRGRNPVERLETAARHIRLHVDLHQAAPAPGGGRSTETDVDAAATDAGLARPATSITLSFPLSLYLRDAPIV